MLAPRARSNPIPINTNLLWLQSENMTIEVSPNNNGYAAEVRGVYPFQLSGIAENATVLEELREEARSEMTMMFPVPPNSENISVKIFDENISWEWADNEYPTELGNFPMIKWIFRIPENMITTTNYGGGWVVSSNFTLVVEYAHSIPLENGGYTLLYALGTGMYLGAYNYWKGQASAYIDTKFPEEVKIVEAKLTTFDNHYPPEFNIDEENNRVTMTKLLIGNTGDYVVEFTAPPRRGVEVSISPSSQTGVNGETLTYILTVTNTGNVSDNYSLTATDNAGWSPILSPTSLTISTGSSVTATLRVTIPLNAVGGTIDNISVTANGTGVSASSSCTAQVPVWNFGGVSVSISPGSQDNESGGTLTYTVTVTNTGTSTDTFTLTASDTENWGPTLSIPSTQLQAGASRQNIRLSIIVPSTAAAGDSTTITVTATGAGYENNATCTATAAAGGGATGGGTSPVVYVGVAVVIVAIIAAVLILKPF